MSATERLSGAPGGAARPAPADFSLALVLVSLVGFAALYDVFGLARHAGAEVSGHAKR